MVRDDIDFEGNRLDLSSAQFLAALDAVVDKALDVTLQTLAKIFEHGGTTGEDDVLVETTTGIDGARLDGGIDDVREGVEEIRGEDLGIEEHLGAQETLVADVDGEGALGDGLNALVLLDPFVGLDIILFELLDHVGADVRVGFLTRLATSKDSEEGMTLDSRSRMSCCTKEVISRPARGMCLMEEPMT